MGDVITINATDTERHSKNINVEVMLKFLPGLFN